MKAMESTRLVVVSYSVIFELPESTSAGYDFSRITTTIKKLLKPLEKEHEFHSSSGFQFKYIGESNARKCSSCSRWACDQDNGNGIDQLVPGKLLADGFYCAFCREFDLKEEIVINAAEEKP